MKLDPESGQAAADLATAIRTGLGAAADPAIAPGQQRYMKSVMPFAGVRLPVVRRIVKDAVGTVDAVATLRTTALLLWRNARFREERYAATAVTRLPPLAARADMLDVHEEMIRTGAWWDHVDEIVHRLGAALAVAPTEVRPVLWAWAGDDDQWIRRAAILAQLGRRHGVDRELLAHAIVANAADPEFFIRKAIGWALRDHARVDPDWVRRFVATHELSPLSRREALKHLA